MLNQDLEHNNTARDDFPLRSVRVLVVDDDSTMQEYLSYRLRHFGYSVVTCAGGDEAQILLQSGLAIDVIISDVEMPSGDGLTLLRALRDAGSDIPFFMMSSGHYVSGQIVEKHKGNGFFSKSILCEKLDDLFECILRSVLSRVDG